MASSTRHTHAGSLVSIRKIFSIVTIFSTLFCVPFTVCSAKEVAPNIEQIEGHLGLLKNTDEPQRELKNKKTKRAKEPKEPKEPKKNKSQKKKKTKKTKRPLVCNVKGPVKNCALYHDDDKDTCVACAEHYELNKDGQCSACVTCDGPWGTLDFCPLFTNVWEGTVPIDPVTGEMPLYPKDSTKACNEYVRWGYDGYVSPDIPAHYCSSSHPMIWVYNITVTQKKSGIIDGVEREVIMSISGDDTEPRVPTRPVYACEKDTIIARTHNELPDHVSGDAWPPKEDDEFDEMVMGISLHWHGMWHVNNHFMDGVSMITQCPIGNLRDNDIPCTSQYNDPNGNRFDYTMLANPDGTYWFHSHTGFQYGDCLFGPLIIFDRPDHNPYSEIYDHEIEPIMMGDWWHRLSQDLAVDLFYGSNDDNQVIDDGPNTGQECEVNNVKCKKAFNPDNWESTFQCLCAGGSSDFPYVSGHINGKGTSPEITMASPISQLKKANYNEVKFIAGKSYRLRIINAGFNFGFRFSIDDHLFTVIAADGGYIESIPEVSHFASMAGERYDIVVQAKSNKDLKTLGGKQFFMRATTYNDTSWYYDESVNAYDIQDDMRKHTIYGVVNYDTRQENLSDNKKKDEWFKKKSKLRKDVQSSAPPTTKVVDVSMYYSTLNYQEEMTTVAADEETVITALKGFRYPAGATIPGCTTPINTGKGPLGAPFGCEIDGTPIKNIPEADLLVHLWVNGIMYPAYNLFLAKSEVLDYKEFTSDGDKWKSGMGEEIGYPNMFARPSEPLIFSRGKYGTRNLDTYGASKDSPGYDPSKSPDLGDFGSFMQQNYGTSGETDMTNSTNLIFLPKNKWVQVWMHNGGPMTHPFHLHGYDTYLLGRDRTYCTAEQTPMECGRKKNSMCSDSTVPEDRWPIMFERATVAGAEGCKKAMSNYVNGYGASMIPPVHGRYQESPTLETVGELNTENPPRRDMTTVPPHGYVAFQFFTDNPGAWFYHCHLEFHAGLGMAVVWMVGADGDDFVNKDATTQQIGAWDQSNCGDVEFEGPIQFY